MTDKLAKISCHLLDLRRNPLARSAAALYGVQICRKVFPLVSIPFLARTLKASGWGTVAFVLSLGEIVALIIEFGFNLSATREISQSRTSRDDCRAVMAGVLGAQGVLASVGVAIGIVVSLQVPLLREHPPLVIAGLLYAVAQGCTPLWFFQGLEKLAMAAGLEIFAKVLGLAALFALVRNPGDAWKVVALQAGTAGVSTVVGIALAFREFSFCRPTRQLVLGALRKGWPMFLFRSAESLYGVGNSFVLGLFAGPSVVAYFAIGEKISKAVFGLLNPVRDALYPRLSYLISVSRDEALRLARTGVYIMSAAGLLLTVCLWEAAPLLIHLFAGSGFSRAVTVLRILSALPLVLSLTYSIGLQWLLPLGRDHSVSRIILFGGIVNLVSAFLVAKPFGEVGMAYSVLAAEVVVCSCMVWTVYRSTDLSPDLPTLAPIAADLPTLAE